jgi:LysM repeat protein/lysophospholipase L1-like esterase
VVSRSYIAAQLIYQKKYSFIQYPDNYLRWQQPAALDKFYLGLRNTPTRKLRVLHIGDSHVQADIHTNWARNRLQNIFGSGGRGLVFPYSAAGTHAGLDYFTRHWGIWKGARNVNPVPALPLGVTGVSIYTTDVRSGFSLRFNGYYQSHDSRRVRILCDCSDSTFAVAVRYNHRTNPEQAIRLRCPAGITTPDATLEFTADEPVWYLQVDMVRETDTQNQFQCFGVSLEAPEEAGVLYHSVGINGAGFRDLLKQERMANQVKLLNPDVVFLDLGGNEFYSAGLNVVQYEERLRNVIRELRRSAPGATVIVGCSQDIHRYHHYPVRDAKPAADLAMRIAFEEGCVFYPYYLVAGGEYSMAKWFAARLAKYDRVHLSYEGYLAKGELFANAFLLTYHELLRGQQNSASIVQAELPQPRWERIMQTPTPSAPPVYNAPAQTPAALAGTGNRMVYTVRSGDVLGSIAERYGVTVAQLQAWNGLSGTLIRVGQPLTIYTNRAPSPSVAVAPSTAGSNRTQPGAPAPQRPSAGNRPQTHTIRSGDTLWGLSQQYGTTIEELCRLNGIGRNSRLNIGQVLRVR